MKKSTNTSDITSSSSENTENSLEDRSDRASEVNSVHTATSPENSCAARAGSDSENVSAQNTDVISSSSDNSKAHVSNVSENNSVQFTDLIHLSKTDCALRFGRDPEASSVEYIDLVPSYKNKCVVRAIRKPDGSLYIEVPISKDSEGNINIKCGHGNATVSADAVSDGKQNELSVTFHSTDGMTGFGGRSTPIYQSIEERDEAICNSYGRGDTQKVTAKSYRISQQRVSDVVRKKKDKDKE